MVENKKRKYGITVSSSEKIDQCARYSGFRLNSMPYPGTEFFSAWKEKGHFGKIKLNHPSKDEIFSIKIGIVD
jgi:hypothetical protein